MSKNVFITGATGYIGGATLDYLLSAPSTKLFTYSALVRNKEKGALLDSLGVRPVLGTIDDADLLTDEAAKADIVIHTAEAADHVPSAKALLDGLKKRGDKPIYIHISGTGVLVDDARGEYAVEEIFSDLDPGPINALPDSAYHRNVDLEVFSASNKVRTHIVLPPIVWGIADHALVRKGISGTVSMVVPGLIRATIDRKQAGMVGKGLNLWPPLCSSTTMLTSAIVTVLEGAVAGKTATGHKGYYFAECKMYDFSAEIGRTLNTKGLAKAEPTSFTEEEVQKYFGGSYWMGGNGRCKADRTRQLGWKATRTTEDFIKSIGPEIDYLLKNLEKKR